MPRRAQSFFPYGTFQSLCRAASAEVAAGRDPAASSALDQVVLEARLDGWGWSDIGRAVGMLPQAARAKWNTRLPTRVTPPIPGAPIERTQ